jgi:Ca2+-binding RTX toxin-like protein
MSGSATLPAGAATIGGFALENAGTGTLASGIATLGQTFAQGELPTGSSLTAVIGATAVPVQVDVKTTWPDGSAKMVVLSVERPSLAPGEAVDVVLARTPSPSSAGAAIDLADALDGQSFVVDLAIEGRTPLRVDVLSELQAALADGSATFWQTGALATQARVQVLVPDSSMRLVFDVTAFKGGGFEVEAVFANDRAMEAVGGRLDYDIAVSMNGQEVLRKSLSQAQYQNWHEQFASTGRDGGQGLGAPDAGWLNIRHDIADLGRLGVVADYDLSLTIPEATLAGFQAATSSPGWGDPFASNGVTTYMPTAGGRADLGITTLVNTAWLISQDPRAAAYALGQAEAASGVTWQFWDEANGTWLNTANYPRIWVDGRGGTGTPGDPNSTGLTQQREGYATTGWAPERAHQPELSFVPYVLTGERWILDNLNAQGAWNLTEMWPYPRQDGLGITLDTTQGQVRSAAWSMRQIENALWAAPDGSAERAYFQQLSDTNWSWLVSKLPEWTAKQGEAHGFLPLSIYDSHAAPWQQDYFASTAISAASRGNQDALTYLDWAKNFLIGRFFAADKGFNPRDGVAVTIRVADPATGEFYKTWAEIGAATVAAGWSHGTDGWGNELGEYGRLALSTLAGIYHLTGDAEALAAYRALEALDYPWTDTSDFARLPQYAVTIPPANTTPGSVVLPDAGGAVTLNAVTELRGGDGDDRVTVRLPATGALVDLGGGGDRLVLSGAGANKVFVLNTEDVVGGAANDFVVLGGTPFATASDSALAGPVSGPPGSNVALGGGNDTVVAGAGIDSLIGGSGADSLVGGGGADLYFVDDARDRVLERAGEGTDRVVSSISLTLFAEVERLTLAAGSAALNGNGNVLDNEIVGNELDNRLAGGEGNDTLSGFAGRDLLIGGNGTDHLGGGTGADQLRGDGGDDTLNGGAGADTMYGGAGNDMFYVDDPLDRVVEAAGGGVDRVVSSASLTLFANVEHLTLAAGSAARDGTGNAMNNEIIGNGFANTLVGANGADTLSGEGGKDTLLGSDGNDLLDGGAGDDALLGGPGLDTLTGGVGADLFRFDGPDTGRDLITDFVGAQDRIELSRAGFGGVLPLGALSPGFFALGEAATTAGPQLIYQPLSGVLQWDRDGTGEAAAVTIAILAGAPALSAGDMFVIA